MSVNVIDWETAIRENEPSVVEFATHKISSKEFQYDLEDIPYTAAFAVKKYGTLYARRLARKALRHRGLLK